MNLKDALRLGFHARVALVGAGGKTSALFALAGCYSGPVLLTTSTHLSQEQTARADRFLMIEDPAQIANHAADFLQDGTTLITGPVQPDHRQQSTSAEVRNLLHDFATAHRLPLLVEADGSRMLPLKAPAEHEPAIPVWANVVVVVAGLSSLGKPLAAENVHRAERFAALAGLQPGDPVTPEALVRVLSSSSGGLKNIPARARRVALLNQADTPELQAAAQDMAGKLLAAYDAIVVASLRDGQVHAVYEREAAIILAAGGSARYGAPKLLMEWQGAPLVRHVAQTALRAGFGRVVVVSGAYDHEVRAAMNGLAVATITNPRWADGQSTSLQTGLAAVRNCGCAVFLLADQPQVTEDVIRKLITLHRATLAPVVAPRVGGRRANPVLFDQITFDDLNAVRGDQGGRAVMERWPVIWMDTEDRLLLEDIDTPEDYHRLLGSEP